MRPRYLVVGGLSVVALGAGLGLGLGLGLKRTNNDGKGCKVKPKPAPENGALWQPKVNSTWQIVLSDPIADVNSITPDVDIWDIDLFTNPVSTISTLKSMGKKVICYWSAGSYEPGRPDSDEFDEWDMGFELDGWPEERWLNLSSPKVRDIMKARMRLSYEKGCDAVDPDNVDGYENDDGLGLTESDSIDFIKFLSAEAVQFNLSIGLKNAANIIPDVLSYVQFSVNEQCSEYSECSTFSAFINAEKPVLHIEYPSEEIDTITSEEADDACSGAEEGFSTLLKNMDLDGFVKYCNGGTESTATDTDSDD